MQVGGAGSHGSHASHDGGYRRGLPAWVARWRAALRIARRDAWRHRGRTSISLAMIGLPVAAAVFLTAFVASSGGTALTRALEQLGPSAQALITDAGCGGCVVEQDPRGDGYSFSGGPTGRDGPDTVEIEAALGGRPVVAEVRTSQPLATATRAMGSASVHAVEADPRGRIYAAREGRLATSDTEAAISLTVAQRLDIGVGDAVTVGGEQLEVTGLLDSRHRYVPDVLTLPDAIDPGPTSTVGWYVLDDDPVTWADVEALNAVGAFAVSRALVLDPPPPDPGDPALTGGYGVPRETVGVGAAVVAIALVEAVLLVGPAFAVGARRQTRNLALLAASGGSRGDLRRTVLATGVVAGLVAGLLGAAVGVGAFVVAHAWLARGWNPLPMLSIPWWAPVGAALAAIGLGTVSAAYPARAAARLDVVAALAGRRSDPPPRRRTSWFGVALAVVGFAVSAAGGVLGRVPLLVGGIVALEIGVVLVTGGLLATVSRAAPHLGTAGRFALRDAVRQRSRTVPAVASVVAAVAAVTAGVVFTSTSEDLREAAWSQTLGVGTITVGGGWELPESELVAEVERGLAAVSEEVPVTGTSIVRGLSVAGAPTEAAVFAWPQVRPDRECAVDGPEDLRCSELAVTTSFGSQVSDGTIVDDGTAIALVRADGAAEAAAALAAGQIVVNHRDQIWPDGTAHVEVSIDDPRDPQAGRTVELVAPAHLLEWGTKVVLPTSLVEATEPLTTAVIGGLARTELEFDPAWADEVSALSGGTTIDVERPYVFGSDGVLAALVGVAALVALAATWLSVGLASAETRPDVATLAAVGAPPRLRRRVVAAQAAVIAVLGVEAGALLGLALGWVLGTWSLNQSGDFYANQAAALGTTPGVTVPWLWVAVIAVVLPLLAVGGAWLTAPRHLPLVRRLAQ